MKTSDRSGSANGVTSTGAFVPCHLNRKWPRQNDSVIEAMKLVIPAGASIADIGAGAGGFVSRLRDCGYRCWGFDGIDGVEQLTGGLVLPLDLTRPVEWLPPADWAICIEVGEHIPVRKEHSFLKNLCSAATDGMVLSWATRAQTGGIGHVNCLDRGEVAARLWRHGWQVQREWTDRVVARVRRPFRKKIMVLVPR